MNSGRSIAQHSVLRATGSAPRPSAIPTVSGPTRLRLLDLLRISDQGAEDVLSGRYAHVLPVAESPPTSAGLPGCTATTRSTSG